MHAVNEGTSPVDLIRGLEAHLAKYPNSVQRADIERSLAKAAIDSNDDSPDRQVRGTRPCATSTADLQLLDRLAYAFLTLGGEENAAKALQVRSRVSKIWCDKMPVATGRDAAHQQDDQERDRGAARCCIRLAPRTIQDDSQRCPPAGGACVFDLSRRGNRSRVGGSR